MSEQYSKSNNKLEVTVTEVTNNTYELRFLIDQKASIERQIALATVELAKINELIKQAGILNIKEGN